MNHVVDVYCRRFFPADLRRRARCLGTAATPDMQGFCRSLLATTLFASNIYFWRSASYFAGTSEFRRLLDTWSLGTKSRWRSDGPWIPRSTIQVLTIVVHRDWSGRSPSLRTHTALDFAVQGGYRSYTHDSLTLRRDRASEQSLCRLTDLLRSRQLKRHRNQ